MNGPDNGLIASWERGREKAFETPEQALSQEIRLDDFIFIILKKFSAEPARIMNSTISGTRNKFINIESSLADGELSAVMTRRTIIIKQTKNYYDQRLITKF